MSVTTPTVHVPGTRVPAAPWIRRHLSWVLIALALVATAVLVTLTVIDGDSVRATPNEADAGSSSVVDRAPTEPKSIADASIVAIDHRAGFGSMPGHFPDQGLVPLDQPTASEPTGRSIRDESIVAIEHRAANGGR